MSDELLKLAERCEAATAEQQDGMLRRAFILLYPEPAEPHYQAVPKQHYFTPEYSEWCSRDSRFRQLMSVRAFLDAAKLLAPEGWNIKTEDASFQKAAWLTPPDGGPCRSSYDRAKTAPLALTAAALRAGATK